MASTNPRTTGKKPFDNLMRNLKRQRRTSRQRSKNAKTMVAQAKEILKVTKRQKIKIAQAQRALQRRRIK